MKNLLCGFLSLAALTAVVCSPASVHAQPVLAYSFESDLEGFGPNGGGISVSQDTIGATDGTSSMKVDIVAGPTFVGALDGSPMFPIGDPPGVESIIFDVTIEPGDEAFTGFAGIGITVFGASQPDFPGGQLFGLQAQFADFENIDGLGAGTHTLVIDLDSALHPLTFVANQSFNEIFGDFGTGPNDVIPTGFQFFFNQSGADPVTVYIDNVRAVVPEPSTALLCGVASVLGLGFRRRK